MWSTVVFVVIIVLLLAILTTVLVCVIFAKSKFIELLYYTVSLILNFALCIINCIAS